MTVLVQQNALSHGSRHAVRLPTFCLFPSGRFLLSGGRCYDFGEQRSCGPRQKSDGQRRRCPTEIAAHQHHGTVLGKQD